MEFNYKEIQREAFLGDQPLKDQFYWLFRKDSGSM